VQVQEQSVKALVQDLVRALVQAQDLVREQAQAQVQVLGLALAQAQELERALVQEKASVREKVLGLSQLEFESQQPHLLQPWQQLHPPQP
jgi:ABC-type nitrate/sulfonate/bicarbonate transport system substrate-binding protein